MKKIFTTLCAIALTTVVAQAQNADADAAAKTQEVKKEAAAPSATNSDAQEVTTTDRAQYEAYKKQQMEARKAKASTPKSANNSGEVKTVGFKDEDFTTIEGWLKE